MCQGNEWSLLMISNTNTYTVVVVVLSINMCVSCATQAVVVNLEVGDTFKCSLGE